MKNNNLRLGQLRHRITLQSLVPVQDGTTGVVSETWVTFATVWASVEPLSVREFVAAAATQSKVVARVRILYLAGVKPSMRAVHVVGGVTHTYNIEGVLPDTVSGLAFLTLPVSEVIHG